MCYGLGLGRFYKRESMVAMGTSDSASSYFQEDGAEPELQRKGDSGTYTRRERLAYILSQIEQIKLWSDAQIHMLQAGLYSRIAELEVEIRALESRSPEDGDQDYSGAIAARLQELAARGDAVYDLLISMLPVGERNGSGTLPDSGTPSSGVKDGEEAGGTSGPATGDGSGWVTPEPEAGSPEHPVAGP